MLLVDTNIWLELLLEQDRADEVCHFLDPLPSDQLAISHFSLHSIGVILGRYGHRAAVVQFVRDLFVVGTVQLVTLPPETFANITNAMETHRLDFDDAYQYAPVRQTGADLISFDTDFDRTDLHRRTPAEALAGQMPPEMPM